MAASKWQWEMEVMNMEADYIVACGFVWRKTLDPEAGTELVEGLQSEDQEIRLLAQTILAESGAASMSLLESSVSNGLLNPEFAGPCMAAILRSQNRIENWATSKRTEN
jgi:hypothetical protein